jgi:hypothetical protein
MKNKMIYWGLTLCLILGFTACSENDNWVIVTDVQPGIYVSGSAVVYKSVAPAASFKAGAVDPDTDERAGVTTIYTWLKASGDLFIIKADAGGNTTEYGKGAEVSNITSSLEANGPAYKVSEDGLYFLIYNANLNQLTIMPAKFGVIGGATPAGWDAETPFTSVSYNESNGTVEMKGTFPFTKDQMKFRFNGDWGVTIPYDETSTIKYHTNMGSTGDDDGSVELTDAAVELKGGGKNLSIPVGAAYDVILTLELRTGKFSAKSVQGEIIEPEFPENLYMTGDEFGNWFNDLNSVVTMTPVNGIEGAFWCINYFTVGKGFKWAHQASWDGPSFAEKGEVIGYKIEGGNAVVETTGLYMVYIDMKNEKIALEPAKVFGIGNAFGSWDMEVNPFTITGDEASITVTASTADEDGGLRMYASSSLAPAGDWWRVEFIIIDGKIVYRGNGGDLERVDVTTGQTVTLDFNAGTGAIE